MIRLSSVSRRQIVETGMLLALVVLLLGVFTGRHAYYTVAVIILLINLILPILFKPLAMVWFGLAQALSMVSSKIILTLLFVLLVVPVGWWRRWRGKDPLQLKAFRRNRSSAFKIREHQFVPTDLDKPY